jgi:gliding motility-associated lipoprotein GldH
MKKTGYFILILLLSTLSACKKEKDTIIYHKFEDQTWNRFNILQFEIPVEPGQAVYDVSFFIHLNRDYEYDYLDFNMIMTTPSGEERIKEYHMDIKGKEGEFLGQWTRDSCELVLPLKKEIQLTKGTLILQIENLVPRPQTRGLLGVGIRMHPVG